MLAQQYSARPYYAFKLVVYLPYFFLFSRSMIFITGQVVLIAGVYLWLKLVSNYYIILIEWSDKVEYRRNVG